MSDISQCHSHVSSNLERILLENFDQHFLQFWWVSESRSFSGINSTLFDFFLWARVWNRLCKQTEELAMTETNRAILINLGLGMQGWGAVTGAESNHFVMPSSLIWCWAGAGGCVNNIIGLTESHWRRCRSLGPEEVNNLWTASEPEPGGREGIKRGERRGDIEPGPGCGIQHHSIWVWTGPRYSGPGAPASTSSDLMLIGY